MADKHGCDSTGNGSGMQEAEIFNFIVQKGALPPETLLRELDNGVYIDKINGLRVGLNTVTGDFSAAAEGFEVKTENRPASEAVYLCRQYLPAA